MSVKVHNASSIAGKEMSSRSRKAVQEIFYRWMQSKSAMPKAGGKKHD